MKKTVVILAVLATTFGAAAAQACTPINASQLCLNRVPGNSVDDRKSGGSNAVSCISNQAGAEVQLDQYFFNGARYIYACTFQLQCSQLNPSSVHFTSHCG